MSDILFERWAQQWLEEKRLYIKQSTYANYKTMMINHLIPAFGEMRIKDISVNRVQKYIIICSEKGRTDGKGGLSDKTIKDMIVVLKMCLRDGGNTEYGICHKKFYYPEKKGSRKSTSLSEIDVQEYIKAFIKDPAPEHLGFLLCLYTGMRIGEICALRWADVNFDEKLIQVNKTLQRIYIKDWENNQGKSKIIISTPKSQKSIRQIPIADRIFDLLAHFRKNSKVYVVTGKETFIEPRLYRKHYRDFVRKHSLTYIKFHGLRHTFASRCIKKGADYKTVSELLGHSSINLTLNLYVHPQMEEKRSCINSL